jgi:hypothetical protein
MRNSFCRFIIVFILTILLPFVGWSQYAPQAGFAGTTAIHKDSSIISTFNNYYPSGAGITLKRGWQNIADTSMGKASVGSADSIYLSPNGYMLSLGDGGSIDIKLPYPIINRLGPDFVVFENGFPFSADSFFLELAFVEVSSDGKKYFRFPAFSLTDTLAQVGPFGGLKAHQLHNFAGKYIMPYGVPFDLNELKDSLAPNVITYIRLLDAIGSIMPEYAQKDNLGNKVNDPWPTPFPSSGFDLHAIGFINVVITEGIDDLNTNKLTKIFPNPVEQGGDVEIEYPGIYAGIKLLDVLGKEVYYKDFITGQQTQIVSASFLPGVYYLLVLDDGKNCLSKSRLVIKP